MNALVDSIEQIQAVEREADEIVFNATREAQNMVGEAEERARAILRDAEETANSRSAKLISEVESELKAEVEARRTEINARIDEVKALADRQWSKALSSAVERIVSFNGNS